MNRFVLNEMSYFGAGCRSVLADEIKSRGFKNVLLVTDKELIKFGIAGKIEEILKGADIPYTIFSELKQNPTVNNVMAGVEAFAKSGADVIVTIGGGSAMDTAKAIGIITNNQEFADVESLEGVAPTKNKSIPIIALPTTAGTAAELTINYVITDEVGNAMLLPSVMKYNMPCSMAKYVDIAKAMGICVDGLSFEESAQKAVDAVKALAVRVGIPTSLKELGVTEESLDVLPKSALNDVCTPGNPRGCTIADITRIYTSLL